MKGALSLFLISLLVCAALAIEQEDGVYVLTKDNFDTFVQEDGVSLVEFYAPWCGHCKKLTPEYAKAAGILKSNDPPVRLGKVDATIESELGQRFGVTGYPTLKVFRAGTPTDYKGPREAQGIVAYMKKQAAPSITILKSAADLEKFIAEEAGVVYFGDLTSKLAKTFDQTAEKLRESFRFAKTDVEEVVKKYNHDGEVVLFQTTRYSVSPLEAKKVAAKVGEDITKFINENVLPLVGEVHQDNQALYSQRGKPLVKVYSDKLDWKLDAKGANYLLNKIRKVAKEYKDKLSFAVASAKQHAKEISDNGLSGDLSFAIHDLQKGHRYPGSGAFSAESFKKHIDDFLAEKLEPYVKSEPVPVQVPGEPTVVVGKNFDSIVMDPTKDVLLEAYAPWCGHCKSLEPKYKELAQKMAPYSDSLVIAKVDATANDLPPSFQVRGYPTIFFVPANNKNKPLNYDGAREVKDFVTYIKKNAHFPLKEKADSTAKDEL
jgi:protein disulfide isomerase family A protein 3